jgi:glucokinase
MRIGVDFGGTHIKAAIVEDGEVSQAVSVDTPQRTPAPVVIDKIAELVRQLEPRPESVGLAIPGQVDSLGMVWRLPNVPGFEAVPIAQELSKRLDCPVAVENDATAAALGEHLWGRGRGFSSFLMVTLGTGIGGGLVMFDKLVRGAQGFAGEIGHIRIHEGAEAWSCPCGQRGCVEAYAGTKGLLRKYRELGGEASKIRQIAESARRGDAAAQATFEFMAQSLGLLLVKLQNLLDLEAYVFTGGISQSFDLLEPTLRAALRDQCFAPPLGQVPLLVSQLGPRAGLVGAAYLHLVRPAQAEVLQLESVAPGRR